MQISIDNDLKKFDDNFFEYLRRYTSYQMRIRCNYSKLKPFEDMLNSQTELLTPFRKRFSGRDVFITGINNLIIKRFLNGKVIIEVNPNVVYYGTQTKLITLIKFLNYGNGEYKGYPIFSDTFDYIEKNIDSIYKLYERTK